MKSDHIDTVVKNEVTEAQKTYPPFHSTHEGIAVIKEEYDELWEEIKKSRHGNNIARIRMEAIHLTAMSIRFLLECT